MNLSKFHTRNALYLSIVFFIALFSAQNSFAQKKELSLEDAVMKRGTTFNPENINRLGWINKGNSYCFIDKEDQLMKVDLKQGKSVYGQLSDLKKSMKDQFGSTLTSWPYFRWMSDSKFRFSKNDSLFSYDLISKKAFLEFTYDSKAGNIDYHAKSKNLAYTIDNNLFVVNPSGSNAISNETNKGIVYGQAAHRSEFGIVKGTFWSKSGKKLAFYRMDEQMVTDYPLIDMTSRVATLSSIKYPMAGMKSHEVTIGVYNVSTKTTIYLKTGEPKEQYLTNISWSPDDKFIYVAVINRDQNHMQWKKFDSSNGKYISTLFEEKDERFTEPENNIETIPNSNKMLFFSKRDGYKQLYIYDAGKIKRISSGNFDITSFHGFDPSGKSCYITGATNQGLDRQLYSLNLKSGKQVLLTKASGSHSTQINNAGYVLDQYSSISVPRKVELLSNKGKVMKTLLTAEDPMKDYNFATTELVSVKNKENISFNCRIIKPSNFDPSKKYPVIVYVYGGPHAQLVHNSWLGSASMWMHHIAQKGYIVFTLDNRGSHNRGVEFSRATFKKLGDVEMEDQLTGVDYLKSLPYVDQKRMAVHGWSFGGFMTTSIMLRQPGVFKVGVAGGPVIDWSLYEIMYGERYMDTPESNPDGYGKSEVSQYVENLDGDLLIIHGQVDPVVVPQHSMQLLKAAVEKGVQIDFFTYPGHPHNVRGKDRVHLMQKVLDYIEDKLN